MSEFFIVSLGKTCQKIGIRASSRVPNTSRFRPSRCLEPVIKHEARLFDILHIE